MPGIYCSTRNLLVATILVAMTISPCPCIGKPATPSFVKTVDRLHQVSRDRSSTRDQWRQVVSSFLAIHEADKGRQRGQESLFLAGKAALDLYRRGGNANDLDEAVKHLNAFNRTSRQGPYRIPGLQALKEADLLKRRIHARHHEKPTVNASGPASLITERQLTRRESPALKESLQENDSIDTDDLVPDAGEKGSEGAPLGGIHNCTGNPFFRKVNKPSTDDSKPVMSASLMPNAVSDTPPVARTPDLTKPKQVTTVVIDPGHGGKDAGAVSANSLVKEKDVTLDIAQRTKRKIEEQLPGAQIVMTRDNDQFVALEERSALANAVNSDLFVSIHCNADTDSSSNGLETYFLSKADSSKAAAVAARENGISISQISDLQATLLDLMITSKKAESVKLAHVVHDSVVTGPVGKTFRGRNRGIKPAPLYVLFGATMPAIMVECGFVSNRTERQNLASLEYRDAVADGIAKGVVKYLKSLGETE